MKDEVSHPFQMVGKVILCYILIFAFLGSKETKASQLGW
jgi:hypothetical protein